MLGVGERDEMIDQLDGVRRKRGEVKIGGSAFWIWEVNVAAVET